LLSCLRPLDRTGHFQPCPFELQWAMPTFPHTTDVLVLPTALATCHSIQDAFSVLDTGLHNVTCLFEPIWVGRQAGFTHRMAAILLPHRTHYTPPHLHTTFPTLHVYRLQRAPPLPLFYLTRHLPHSTTPLSIPAPPTAGQLPPPCCALRASRMFKTTCGQKRAGTRTFACLGRLYHRHC